MNKQKNFFCVLVFLSCTPYLLAVPEYNKEASLTVEDDLNSPTANFNSILHQITQKGADPNTQNIYGQTVLHRLITQDMQKELSEKYLTEVLKVPGISCVVQDKKGNTPLHLAVQRGKIGVFNQLLEICEKARFVKNEDGKTPFDELLILSLNVISDVTHKLALQKEENYKESLKEVYLGFAEELFPSSPKSLLQYYTDQALKAIRGGAHPNQVVTNGWHQGSTLLHIVVQNEELYAKKGIKLPDQAIEVLLKAGANPLLKNREGKTAVELATPNTKEVLTNFTAQQKQSIMQLAKGLRSIN